MTHSDLEIVKTLAAIAGLVGVCGAFLLTDADASVRMMGGMLCWTVVAWCAGFGACLWWRGRRR